MENRSKLGILMFQNVGKASKQKKSWHVINWWESPFGWLGKHNINIRYIHVDKQNEYFQSKTIL